MIGVYVHRYEAWMRHILQPYAQEELVTNLPVSQPHQRCVAGEQFPLYTPSRILYHLDSSDRHTFELIAQHLQALPQVEVAGFYQDPTGRIYYYNHQQMVEGVTRMGLMPDQSKAYHAPNGIALRPYQNQLVDFALQNRRVGLFVDMGLGKTLATLTIIDQLHKQGKLDTSRPILVVAPILVALDTWAREAQKWGYDWDVKVNIQLTPKKRNELFNSVSPENIDRSRPTILTTNPDQLPNLLKFFNHRGEQPFQTIIVDELSMFKSPTTKRYENLRLLSDRATYFMGLTGTPAPNTLLNVWSQAMCIDPIVYEKTLGGNYFRYRERFFEPDMVNQRTGQVYSYKVQPGADQVIYDRLKPKIISLRTDGRVVLPSITYSNEVVALPEKAKKQYQKWATEVRRILRQDDNAVVDLLLDDDTGAGTSIANTAVLTSKLLQLASGAVYDDLLTDEESDTASYTTFHDEKFKRLAEIAETATSPLLVFYRFKSDLERAKTFMDLEHLGGDKNKVRDTITRWNHGKIPVLFVNPQSASHGLNIQDGGHTIIWLTPTWSNETYRQANKRLHRSGQTQPVQVIHLVAEGTVDEELLKRLNQREETQQGLMSALER